MYNVKSFQLHDYASQINAINFMLIITISLIRYYEGSSPVIVTSDPDVIKEVFVKQFNNFYGRRVSNDNSRCSLDIL